jgi:hypothetical protein
VRESAINFSFLAQAEHLKVAGWVFKHEALHNHHVKAHDKQNTSVSNKQQLALRQLLSTAKSAGLNLGARATSVMYITLQDTAPYKSIQHILIQTQPKHSTAHLHDGLGHCFLQAQLANRLLKQRMQLRRPHQAGALQRTSLQQQQ